MENEDEKRPTTMKVGNGWILAETGRGELVIYEDGPLGVEPDKVFVLTKSGIEVDRPNGCDGFADPDLSRALRSILMDQAWSLGGHRREHLAMWERLFVTFAESSFDDFDNAHTYLAAANADSFMREWEKKRKQMGLPHASDEELSKWEG